METAVVPRPAKRRKPEVAENPERNQNPTELQPAVDRRVSPFPAPSPNQPHPPPPPPAAMEALAAAPRPAKRRKPEMSESPEHEGGANISPRVAVTSAPESSPPGAGGDESHIQDPPPGAAGEEEDGVDRISSLPDAILGEVISLLPNKDAARTQILATRWRHLWRCAPVNLDASHSLTFKVISRILSAHRGPGRCFHFHAQRLKDHPATVDAWLRSPALDNFQEIDCWTRFGWGPEVLELPPPPASIFRFSSCLCVATLGQCHISDDIAQTLQFPKLKKLAFRGVRISEDFLHSIIAGSPVLECLLLHRCFGFRCVRINSASLTSIGVYANDASTVTFLEELIIEDAPCLKRILNLPSSRNKELRASVISAPNLETVGCLSCADNYKLVSGSMIIESYKVRDKNLWRRKHHNLIQCHDIRLKTVVLTNYRGIKSQVNFATFFVLNAKILETMTFQCRWYDVNVRENFLAEQHQLLQVEKKASRCARFYFTTKICDHSFMHIDHVHDLSKTDPFECEEARAGVCASFE